MHDTAHKIGGAFLDLYCKSIEAPRVLEIGAMNVNGGLRDFSKPGWDFVGVDIEAGPGVDQVVDKDAPLPFDDDSFDIVVASSVLEHDPFFWETFCELARVCRPNGHIYLNVPSNGVFHRYPSDYWRLYPEAGAALARWAGRQGHDVVLVESFIAEREADHWNDFVGIFRMGRDETPPERFLHETIACRNVLRLGVEGIVLESRDPEDVRLLLQAQAELEGARRLIAMQDDLLIAHEAAQQALRALVRPQPIIEGCVDLVTSTRVVGWALSRAAPQERVSIFVAVDESLLASGQANVERPDLVVLGAGATDYGFALTFTPPRPSGRVKIWAIGPWGRQLLGEGAF
jgi:SAM-dependent methyltransferase